MRQQFFSVAIPNGILVIIFMLGISTGLEAVSIGRKEQPLGQQAPAERTVQCRNGILKLESTPLEIQSGGEIDFYITTYSSTSRLPNVDLKLSAGGGQFIGLGGSAQFPEIRPNFIHGRTDQNGEVSIRWVAPSGNGTFVISLEAFEIGFRQSRQFIPGEDCWLDIDAHVVP